MVETRSWRPPLVLVVDDEPSLLMLATDVFQDAGFEVVVAASGREALEILNARDDVAAVVTDVQMPGDPDGLELARACRERCAGCAIVVVSGRAIPTARELAIDAVFLSKPYEHREIVATVERLLARTA